MPKLPDATNLNGVNIGAPRSLVDIPVPDYAGAANAVSQGVGDLGAGVANFANARLERAKKQERFDTKMGLIKADEEVYNRTKDLDRLDPQYPEKVRAAKRDIYGSILSGVKDPETRMQLELETEQDYVQTGLKADEEHKTARTAKTKMDLQTYADVQINRLVDEGVDPEKARASVLQMIEDAELDTLSKLELGKTLLEPLDSAAVKNKAVKFYTSGGSAGDKADAILRKFEGFRAKPYYDVDNYRVGYGSDTVTLADGSVVKVREGMVISKADAERDLKRRRGEFMAAAARDSGEAWNNLSPDQQAALTSVAYNYGSLPKRVVRAIQTGDADAIANAVESLSDHNGGVNRKRREAEAAIIRGGAVPSSWGDRPSIDDVLTQVEQDPSYLRLSPDQRETVKTSISTTLKAEEDAQFKQYRDSLDLGIEQGTVTREAIEGAPLEDKDKATLLRRFDERNKDAMSTAEFATRLAEGTVNPKAPADRKMAGKFLDVAGGGKAIVSGEPGSVAALYDIFDQTGIVPDNAKGAFEAMLRSKDTAKVTTALSYLAELDRRNHRAFQQEFDESTEGLVQQYRDSLDYATPEQAAGQVMQALDPATEALRRERAKVAEQAAAKITIGDVKDKFDPSYLPFTEPELTLAKDAEAQLMLDYRKLYVEAYKQTGNEKQAQKIAAGQLTRVWGTSSANGGTIMKWPPEALYGTGAMVNGSFDWMGQEVKDLLKERGYERTFAAPVTDEMGNVVGTTEQVSVAPHFLLADAQTLAEHQSGKPPSYQVWILDEDGSYDVVPGRVFFDPAAARKRMQPQLEADRQENLGRRQKSEAELARQRLEGVAPIPGGDPLTGGGGVGLAPADLNEKIGAP